MSSNSCFSNKSNYSLKKTYFIFQGVLYPSLHNLISKWAPPDERGKFVSALLGGTFGTVATWPLAGILMESFGWAYAFYVPAAITALVTIIWFAVVHDSPAEHPRITSEEKEYIEKALGDNVSKKKVLFVIVMASRNKLNINFVYSLIEIPSIFESTYFGTILIADRFTLR